MATAKYDVQHSMGRFRIDIDSGYIMVIGLLINNETEWKITILSMSVHLTVSEMAKHCKALQLADKIARHLQEVAKSTAYNKLRKLSGVHVSDSYGFTLITLEFSGE